jgi:hypothetical protein
MVRYRFPNSLPVEEFVRFLGENAFPGFTIEVHTLVFYYADEKSPYRFESARIGDCLPTHSERLRFIVFLFSNLDHSILEPMMRFTICSDHGTLDRIVEPTMQIGELICTTAEALGLPMENVRLIALYDDIFDGIFRSDIPVSFPEVQNPLWIEETPKDQRNLGPNDKLVAVKYLRMRDDIKPEYEQIGREYLRIIPYEKWMSTRERLNNCSGEKIRVELDHRFRRERVIPVRQDTVLWNLIGDMSVLRITYE